MSRLPLIALLALFSIPARSDTAELSQHLREKYQDKTFLLRGFYSGDKLNFDASGSPIGDPSVGSWTTDGFILITEAEVSGQSLLIKGRRILLISKGHGFQFRAGSPKERKNASKVEIHATIGDGNPSEEVDALITKIFLSDRDSLLGLVPSYWQTCVSAGLNEVNDSKFSACRFSPELLTVPGANAHADLRAAAAQTDASSHKPKTAPVFRVSQDISPPRQIYAPEPQFSSVAREIRMEGVIALGMIVDEQGTPRNVEVLSPIGAGLDEEAVRTVSTWKFKPAEKKGLGPVAVKIAVEIAFHL